MDSRAPQHFNNVMSAVDALRSVCFNIGFLFDPTSGLSDHPIGTCLVLPCRAEEACFTVRMAFDTASFFEEFTATHLAIERTRQIILQLQVRACRPQQCLVSVLVLATLALTL